VVEMVLAMLLSIIYLIFLSAFIDIIYATGKKYLIDPIDIPWAKLTLFCIFVAPIIPGFFA
jgi:hypothetical protein